MDRRGFLKALGIGLSSCYWAVPAVADQSPLLCTLADQHSPFPRAIKVVSIGNDNSLVASMQRELSFCSLQIPIEFIAIQGANDVPIHNSRTIRLPFAGGRGLYDLSGNPRRLAWKMQDEIKAAMSNADLVLLAVALDSDIAVGTCDIVAKLARDSGALTVALVGAPLVGSEGRGGIAEEQAKTLSEAAINRMLNEADCVYATKIRFGIPEGEWGSDWGYTYSIAHLLMFTAGLPLSSTIGNQLRSLFTQSGRVIYGYGNEKNAEATVDQALNPELYYWAQAAGKIPTAASGLVVVSSHPQSISDSLAAVKAAITRNPPLKSTGKPYWRKNSNLIFLARQEDFFDPVEGNMSVEIISTNIEYET